MENLTEAQRTQRMMHEVCPFRVGQTVLVKQGEHMPPWASDWAGEPQIITGIHWDYQKAGGDKFNISLAGEADIVTRNGDTDGFSVDHLEPYSR